MKKNFKSTFNNYLVKQDILELENHLNINKFLKIKEITWILNTNEFLKFTKKEDKNLEDNKILIIFLFYIYFSRIPKIKSNLKEIENYLFKISNSNKNSVNFLIITILKSLRINDIIKQKRKQKNFASFIIPAKNISEIFSFFTEIIKDIQIEDVSIKCSIKFF